MILFVCTGNICRSAMGKILLCHHAELQGVELEMDSAGVLAWEGSPVTKDAEAVLGENSIRGYEHSSKPLTHDLVSESDLVIVMTREHANAVVSRHPEAKNYTFLPKELMRLAAYTKGSAYDLKTWTQELNQIRQELPSPTREAKSLVLGLGGDEVSDPAIGDMGEHRLAFKVMDSVARLLVETLGMSKQA